MYNNFNNNEDETVRQTLERVMREKGMYQEPSVMHTEIGDFSYYDDNNPANPAANNTLDSGSATATGGFDNGLNNGTTGGFDNNQGFGTTDYTVNTESLVGQPSSYFQNNNQQQLRIPAGSEQQITMPSYELQQQLQQPQTSAWDKVKNAVNNFAGGTEAFSVGYATGATLGNFDEAMGTATAAVTGNRKNYTMGRDATRQLQNDLQQQHPIAYGVGEFTGAMTTPMHLAKDTTFANKALNAFTDTINASAGYANNWNDFATNLAVNGIANNIGLQVEQLPIWRAAGSTLGKFVAKNGLKTVKQGINSFADKTKKMFYKEDEDEKKYHY